MFFTAERRVRRDFVSLDLSDEIVTIYHTAELTQEQKQIIVGHVCEIVTLKKSIYKKEKPHVCICLKTAMKNVLRASQFVLPTAPSTAAQLCGNLLRHYTSMRMQATNMQKAFYLTLLHPKQAIK